MIKKLILFVGGLFMLQAIIAQDILITKTAEKIEAIITEVSDTEITYKKNTNQDAPTFTIATSELNTILYQNGEVQVFENNSASVLEYNDKMDRISGIYYYHGQSYTKRQYASFLKENCSLAY